MLQKYFLLRMLMIFLSYIFWITITIFSLIVIDIIMNCKNICFIIAIKKIVDTI